MHYVTTLGAGVALGLLIGHVQACRKRHALKNLIRAYQQ